MERRRLRLHGAPPSTSHESRRGDPGERVPAGGRCVSVTDTEQGNLATLWALDLLEACAGEGARLPVVFTAFDAQPELAGALSSRVDAAASQVHLRAVSSDPTRYAEALSGLSAELAAAPWWLLVGEPALLAFAAPASVLVSGELGPERWPSAVRRLRSGLALEVPGVRPTLARALARALLTTP